MSDLIERLRAHAALHRGLGVDDDDEQAQWARDLLTAADEIERLTAALRHEADCVEAAKAEIERLTAENRRLRADLLAGRNVVNAGLTIHTLTAERDDLRRQLAEAEMDAERYRWLRANREFCVAAYPEGEWVIPAGMVFLGYSNPDADSWIDAARSLESSNE